MTAAFGCATPQTFTAEVELEGPVGSDCMMRALGAEQDVTDLEATADNAVAFRVAMPGVKPKHRPDFSLVQELGENGAQVLSLSTDYETGVFEPDALPLLMRARALVEGVTETCTGHRPTLGETKPCGSGELEDLCVSGE